MHGPTHCCETITLSLQKIKADEKKKTLTQTKAIKLYEKGKIKKNDLWCWTELKTYDLSCSGIQPNISDQVKTTGLKINHDDDWWIWDAWMIKQTWDCVML